MNDLLTCPDLEELASWIDGSVDGPTRVRLEAHVAVCDRCADLVDNVLAFDEEVELAESTSTDGSDQDSRLEIDLDPAHDILPPVFSRVRWRPYLALAVTACLLLVGIRLLQDRSAGVVTLRQELLDLQANSETTRSESETISEEELALARKCRRFLTGANPAVESDVLTGCLDLVARNSDLASQVVAEAPGFAAWLADTGSSGTSSCKVLEAAWNRLRGTRQKQLRPRWEDCQERLLEAP